MIRNLRVLGLAVMAVLAVSALWASVAAAHTPATFTSKSTNTTLTAEQENNQLFQAGGQQITCKEARFEATTSNQEVQEVTFQPKETTAKAGEVGYGACTFGVKVQVKMNGCDYLFTANNQVHIQCPAGKEIEFEGSFIGIKCLVKIPAQGPRSLVTYKNIGTGTTEEITVEANVQGITYTAQGSGCKEQGEKQNGVYTGNAVATGEVDGNTTHTGIKWDATVA